MRMFPLDYIVRHCYVRSDDDDDDDDDEDDVDDDVDLSSTNIMA